MPEKLENGPSTMRTWSPLWKWNFGFGFSAATETWLMMRSTSSCVSGVGFSPEPTKPVTLGVFLTTCQVVSLISMLINTYPGKNFFLEMTLAPSRISTTSSVGMRISPMLSTIPSASALCLRLSRTLFSYPEYVCTMYHCFAMVTRLHLSRMLEDPIDGVEQERVHDPQEKSEDEHRHDDDKRGALDFLPGRPGGPLQLPL